AIHSGQRGGRRRPCLRLGDPTLEKHRAGYCADRCIFWHAAETSAPHRGFLRKPHGAINRRLQSALRDGPSMAASYWSGWVTGLTKGSVSRPLVCSLTVLREVYS